MEVCLVYAEGTRLSMNSEGRVCADFGDFPAMGVKEGYLHDEDTDLLLRVYCYERNTSVAREIAGEERGF